MLLFAHSKNNRNVGYSHFMLLTILCLFLWGLIGCSSSEMDPIDTEISNLQVLPNDESFIALGQQVQLEAKATNSSGIEVSSGSVTWVTSNPAILSVSSSGLLVGLSTGSAKITATAGGVDGAIDFEVVDLTGTWVGGEGGDTVRYTLMQTDTIVNGVFESVLGFPPITDVNTGSLTGSLNFARYFHILNVTTEDGCTMQIMGAHRVIEEGGELVLSPGTGVISSPDCSISGTIDFAKLRRE